MTVRFTTVNAMRAPKLIIDEMNSSVNFTASSDTTPTMRTACVGVRKFGWMYDRNRGMRPLPLRPIT